ncbi:hypothetical protein LB505_012824 [Fusarium chuoi]|nr:hypothetical protein LB505_012824 [Fusarium chuoi]
MPAEENEPLASPTREEEEPTETSPLLDRSDDGNHDDDSEREQNGRASNEPQSRAAWSLWSIYQHQGTLAVAFHHSHGAPWYHRSSHHNSRFPRPACRQGVRRESRCS